MSLLLNILAVSSAAVYEGKLVSLILEKAYSFLDWKSGTAYVRESKPGRVRPRRCPSLKAGTFDVNTGTPGPRSWPLSERGNRL